MPALLAKLTIDDQEWSGLACKKRIKTRKRRRRRKRKEKEKKGISITFLIRNV